MGSIGTLKLTGSAGCLPCCPSAPCPLESASPVWVISGINTCLGNCVNNLSTGSNEYSAIPISPTVTTPWNGLTDWEFTDAGTNLIYDGWGSTASCVGMSTPGSESLTYVIVCGGGSWAMAIFGNGGTSFGSGALIFYAAGTGALPNGTPIANQLTACNQAAPAPTISTFTLGNSAAYGGTVTLAF